jgi:hypothetical protein
MSVVGGENGMKFHTTLGCALGLLIGLGTQSQAAPEKPLDIMKFMREQAASTRAAEPRKPQAAAKAHRPAAHHAVKETAKITAKNAAKDASKDAPKPKTAAAPAPMLPEAAAAFAAPPPVASPFPPPPSPQAETVGAAVPTGPKVQMVDAGELNDIDRKVEVAAPISATPAPAPSAPASTSWLSAIWSALGNLFGALVAAVHQLIGI